MFSTCFARHKGYTLAVLALLALLLAACGGSNTNATVGTTLSNQATATATPTKTAVGGNSATATLKHEPTGTVNLSWDHTSHQLTTKIMMTGLAPSSVHPVNVYQENCTSSQNYNKSTKPVYSLTNVTADAHGVVNSTTKTMVPDGIPAKNWSVVIYNGPTLGTSVETAALACADVVNHDTSLRSSQTAQATFQATKNGNEDVSGNATLSLSNRTLTVKMTVTGLAPNSSHMVHIHAGTCASQGPVIYPLQVLKADASGKATTTTNIPNVMTIPANGWYINVHDSTDISTQTGFNPISCGDVTLK
jgi:hypothetical protein